MSIFLTGTDTGVGKTYTAVCLLRLLRAHGLRCAGMKPICCGDRQDAEMLLAASSDGLSIDEVNPVWLRTPAAPLTAALIEGVPVGRSPYWRGWRTCGNVTISWWWKAWADGWCRSQRGIS